MISKKSTTTAAALIAAVAASTAAAGAPPVPADLIIAEGDLIDGRIVDILNAPFTNSLGQLGTVVAFEDSTRGIFFDGTFIFNSSDETTASLTGGEGTMGVSDAAGFIYSPSFDGNDAVYDQDGLIVLDSDPAPGFPDRFVSFASRPRMNDIGERYWISGLSLDPGGGSIARVLYRKSAAGIISPVVASGDVIEGQVVDSPSGVDFDFAVSGDGSERINVINFDTGSTSDDTAVVVDNVIIAQETGPTSEGDNWDNFDIVSINNNGNYIFTGDTDGPTASDEFIAYNGVIALREGDVFSSGVQLESPASLRAASINNLNQVAHIWDTDNAGERLFFTPDPTNFAETFVLLTEDDAIDINNDGNADFIIDDFNASSGIGPGLDLAEDGFVYIEVDLEPIAGGEDFEAIIRLAIPGVTPPCTGDLNNDNTVDALDLGILLGAFATNAEGDLNNDNVTDALDLGILLGVFGNPC